MTPATPSDWSVVPLGRLATLERGKFSARPRNDPRFFGGKYPFIQTGDVRSGGGEIASYSQTLNDDGLRVSRLFPAGTLFITIAANIGDLGISRFDCACPDSLVAVRPSGNTRQDWLRYALSSRKSDLESIATQNAQANLNLEKLSRFPLLTPPPKVQAEIANALGAVDDLVTSLERLIAKKLAIKQGMMRRLLKAASRLPGFRGEWVSKTYGDLVLIERGDLLNAGRAAPGPVPVIAAGRLPAAFTNMSNRSAPVITISASGASAGFVAYYDVPIFASDCLTISPNSLIDLKFIYYSLAFQQDSVYRTQAGGAQPHVHARDIYPLELILPPTLGEQQAIARELGDADEELGALQRRLSKIRAVKQGMMQELLSGRTLLPLGERSV